jgi:hypothetical protein
VGRSTESVKGYSLKSDIRTVRGFEPVESSTSQFEPGKTEALIMLYVEVYGLRHFTQDF